MIDISYCVYNLPLQGIVAEMVHIKSQFIHMLSFYKESFFKKDFIFKCVCVGGCVDGCVCTRMCTHVVGC